MSTHLNFLKKTMLATMVGIEIFSFSLNSYADNLDNTTVLEAKAAAEILDNLTTETANSEHFLKLLTVADQVGFGVSTNQESAESELDKQAAILADDLEKFAADLVANNEKEVFDTAVIDYAKALGGEILVRELTSAGGPHAILTKSRAILAKNMNGFKQDTPPSIDLLSFLGISTAQATSGIRSTACGAFWFVASWGYGTNIAYRSCYY